MDISERSHISDIPLQEWNELLGKSPEATVFQTHEWLSAWWAIFGEPRFKSRILVAHNEGRLIGALPLHEIEGRFRTASRHVLKWMGNEHTDYHCVLSEDGDPRIVKALLEAAIDLVGTRGEILLEELPQFSVAELLLAEKSGSSNEVVIRTTVTPCPRLRLLRNEEGVAAVLNKKSMRRNIKRLALQGKIDVQHMTDPEEICRYLPRFFEQHVQRWRPTPFSSLFENQANRRFYERLTKTLGSRGGVLFSSLNLNGAPVAFHFGLHSKNDLIWYKPSFDVKMAKLSPGEVLLRYLIEHSIEKGFSALDFTRGDEAFKNRFSSDVHYNLSYLITRDNCRGRLIKIKRVLRSALGRRSDVEQGTRVVLGGAIVS